MMDELPGRFLGYVMVSYCTMLHITWAILLMIDSSAVGATAISGLANIFYDHVVLSVTLILAGILALLAAFTPLPWMILFMLPQQTLLLISAFGVISAIASSQFADGVVRPRAFIGADQIDMVYAALCHAAAIVYSTYGRLRGRA
jgi:hypothetical protein